jgi:hypothetical protein
MQDIVNALGSVMSLAAFLILAGQLCDKAGWILNGAAAQFRVLFIGVILGEGGAAFHIGMFSDPTVFGTMAWYFSGLVVGLTAGLTANWSFATPIIQWILTLLGIRVPWGVNTEAVKFNPKEIGQ